MGDETVDEFTVQIINGGINVSNESQFVANHSMCLTGDITKTNGGINVAGVLCRFFLCVQRVGIFLTTLPVKVSYYVGDELDLTGLQVTERKRLNDFNRQIPLSDVEISGFDSQTPCEQQEIVVTYKGESASFFVKINDLPEVQKAVIKIQLVPEEGYEIKTDYYLFEARN